MDWDGKMPSWDLGTVVGPSGGGGGALDLKLGAPTTWKPVVASSSAAPVALPVPQHHHHHQQQQQQGSPAPAKRPRAVQGQQTVPACLVEGCAADLSKCREYHRRHKVCEAHSKTPVVSVAGQQQRFCQQCSRFHLLGEFDEVKRSCRKRLDGHNRRRRKPQPDPLSHGGLFGNHHGATRFASYPQIFSTTSMAEPAKWPASTVKMETDVFQDQYYPTLQLNGGASLFHGKGRKHFPFLTDHGDPSAAFSCQPFTITPSSESSSNSSRHSNGKMFAHDGGLADNCALSLLSDNPTPAQIMIPGGTGMKYGNVARLSGDGDVSLTGLSYARVGDKETSSFAKASTATTTSAAASATQLQYHHHGYYHVDQGNSDGAIHAVPFSSW